MIDYGSALRTSHFRSRKGFLIEGSLPYVAPEVLNGRAPFFDGRSDIFSLGVILYEMLTKQMPFGDRPLHEIRLPTIRGTAAWQHMQEVVSDIFVQPPRPIRQKGDFDSELASICDRVLAYDLRDRFGSAGDLKDALEKYKNRPTKNEDRREMSYRQLEDIEISRCKKGLRRIPAKRMIRTPPRDDSKERLIRRPTHRRQNGIVAAITELEFSPSGRVLMSVAGSCETSPRGSRNQRITSAIPSIRLWDAETGEQLAHIRPTMQSVPLRAGFLKDNSILAISPGSFGESRDLTTK